MVVRKQTYGGWFRIPAPVDSNRWCIPLFIFIYRLSTCFNHPFGGLSDFFFHPQYPAPNLPSSWKSYTNESPRLFATFARRAKEQFCKISEPDFDMCTSDTCKKMVYPKDYVYSGYIIYIYYIYMYYIMNICIYRYNHIFMIYDICNIHAL
jgi:hypothetical protein